MGKLYGSPEKMIRSQEYKARQLARLNADPKDVLLRVLVEAFSPISLSVLPEGSQVMDAVKHATSFGGLFDVKSRWNSPGVRLF